MAGGSVIGALRVNLGLDSAEFASGLKNASSTLNKFGVQLTLGLETVVENVGKVVGALPRAIDGAIDKFDEMSKAAQKVGLTTESLSQLSYAAGLSDVSLEQLTGGLQRLSKSMADVATGSKGPAATAFAALGIAITDASGKLRSSGDVLADVADKFSRMENGSTKTALAMQLFGKTGAELIPLLNSGRDGLKQMADESDRLGNTISSSAGANAEAFNDNITRLQTAMGGIVNIITTAALPTFAFLSEKFVEVAGNGRMMQSFADGFVLVLKTLISTTAVAATAVRVLGEAVASMMAAGAIASTGFQNWGYATEILKNGFINLQTEIGATTEFLNGLWAAVDTGAASGDGGTPLQPFIADLDALSTSTAKAAEANKLLQQAQQEGLAVFQNTRTPLENMQMDLDKLGALLNQGAIDWDTYGRAVNAATMNAASTTIGSLGQITGALAGAFKDNKAFAVANAVVNTAEGVTKALAQGGMFGFATAAAIGAAGAAQVAAILSAQPGSSSVRSAPAAAAPPTAVAPAAAEPGKAVNITFQGLGRAGMEQFVRELNDAIGDGVKLNLSPA